MYELPTRIEILGQSFAIRDNGDYRMVLDCFNVLNDYDLTQVERLSAALITFYDGFNDIEDLDAFPDIAEAVIKMYEFFNCRMPEVEDNKKDYKLIDWDIDEMLVVSAINQVAGKEVRAEKYIHWWTFMGYYMAVGECALSTVVSIRHKIATNKTLEKHEKKFRIENPQYFTFDVRSKAQQAEEAEIRRMWNSGKG